MHNTFITAHAGADGTPDNSLAYVHHVLFTTADALEIDIRRQALSGELIISHDSENLNAPKLKEVFALIKKHPSISVNCDLKEPGLEAAVYELGMECGLGGRLIFTGAVHSDLLQDEEFGRSVTVYLNLEEFVEQLYFRYRDIPDFELTAAHQILQVCKRTGAKVVNVCQAIVTRRFIEILAAQGVGVSVWTVNEPDQIDYFLSKKLFNLTTKNLSYALKVLGR